MDLPLPALRLPLPRRRLGPGAIVAVALHGFLILAFWSRPGVRPEGALGDPGPAGGGGGKGQPAVRFLAVPAAAPAQPQVARPPEPAVPVPAPVTPPLKLPEVARLEIPRLVVAQVPVTVASAPGTGGAGPGSGGGTGSGVGPGTGSRQGPGTGGEGGYILPAVVQGLIVPPDCARGQFAVRFSVEVEGRVSRVEVDPLPKDAGCRREFLARMREFRFKPAMTVDGRPMASVYTVTINH